MAGLEERKGEGRELREGQSKRGEERCELSRRREMGRELGVWFWENSLREACKSASRVRRVALTQCSFLKDILHDPTHPLFNEHPLQLIQLLPDLLPHPLQLTVPPPLQLGPTVTEQDRSYVSWIPSELVVRESDDGVELGRDREGVGGGEDGRVVHGWGGERVRVGGG